MNTAANMAAALTVAVLASGCRAGDEGEEIDGLSLPVALAEAPDGRIFVSEKETGNVRLIEDSRLVAEPVIHFDVATAGEWGLLGIALHPDFTSNHLLYVYYMEPEVEGRSHPVVMRFREEGGRGMDAEVIVDDLRLTDLPVGAPEVDLFSNIHVGGNLHFGPDGYLYVSIGEYGVFENKAQDLAEPLGKILRIDSEGNPAPGNPFADDESADPRVYAYGLRNPFDFDWAPDGTLYAIDNGPDACDEVNLIVAGGNYGWPSNRVSSDSCERRDGAQAIHYLARRGRGAPENNSTVGPSSLLYLESGYAGHDGPGLAVCEVNTGRLRYLALGEEGTTVTDTSTIGGDCFTDVIELSDGSLLYTRADALVSISN